VRAIVPAIVALLLSPLAGLAVAQATKPADNSKDAQTVRAEHSMIGLGGEKAADPSSHPDAQWYPDAAFGLFLHWSTLSASTSARKYSCPEYRTFLMNVVALHVIPMGALAT
jgi:hypothetical protein